MATIVYLDADDEITSAAARLRAAGESKVGLVVPFGSRLATSRINFRLLAREAQTRGRQLAIVAPDAATRALAGSAGLTVFATVGEYEAALSGEKGAPPVGPAPAKPPPEAASPTTAVASEVAKPARRRPRTPPPDLEATLVVPAVPAAPPAPGPGSTVGEGSGRNRAVRVVGPRRLGFSRNAMLVGAAALAVIVLVVGVGAYVFLPSATIRLTPRVEALVPLSFEVRADPAVSAPDADAGVVPAERITIPLGVTGTFPASGKRVEETKASGEVTFENYDPTSSNGIAAGSLVATEGGVQFRTLGDVTLPPAQFVIPQIIPSERSVAIEAVAAGPAGNVAANTITAVPTGENPTFTRVNNRQPTAGGTRTEFPRVEQGDVDGALGELSAQLVAQLDERLADPSATPAGMTLFPATKALGPTTPSVDPATLVGREVASFDLGLTATGEVTAVDEAPLRQLADARIRDAVDADHRLVEGSIEVSVGQPTIDGAIVLFPVSARAEQVRILDAAELLAAVKGRPIPQARATLEQYGTVELEVWPDWVTAIPTLDSRLSLTIVGGTEREPGESASPSPSPASASPSPASASPSPASASPSLSAAPGSASPSASAVP
jgi:hypothetical protein